MSFIVHKRIAQKILANTTPQLQSIRHDSGLVGKKQIQQISNWVPTAMTFGAVSFVGMLYFTDWRVVNEWIPFYGGKFKPEVVKEKK